MNQVLPEALFPFVQESNATNTNVKIKIFAIMEGLLRSAKMVNL